MSNPPVYIISKKSFHDGRVLYVAGREVRAIKDALEPCEDMITSPDLEELLDRIAATLYRKNEL